MILIKRKIIYSLKNSQRGAVMLVSVIFFLFLSLVIVTGLVSPTVRGFKIANDLNSSKQSFFLAESGIEDAFYRLKNSMSIDASEIIILNGNTATTTITDSGSGEKTIASLGDVSSRQRKNEIVLTTGVGVSFSYGIQAGNGGLVVKKYAGVVGNVYANGDIIGTDSTSFITGTAYAADTAPTVADQTNTTPIPPSSSIIFGNASATEDVAESFQVSQTGQAIKVSLYLRKTGAPSNLTVRITTNNNGKPSNTTLASGTISSSIVTGSYGWIDSNFSSNPTLSTGVTYWIVIDGSTGSGTKYYEWATNTAYAIGSAKIGKQGGTWNATSPSNLDGYFSLYMGGVTSTIDTVTIGQNGVGNAYANQVKNSIIAGGLYCQTGSGNNKVCDTSQPNPSPLDFPISDANIQQWKDDASVGGTISGNYTPAGSNSTLGPKKINGNLLLTAGHTLTLTGGVWVTGDIFTEGSAKIILDPSFGTSSGVLVADGQLHMEGNGLFSGSGQPGSYVLLLSTLHCDGTSTTSSDNGHACGHHNGAIDLHDDTDARGVIMYAKDGQVNMHKRVKVTEIAAKKIILGDETVLTYEQGATNLNFFTGPTGGWNINSWKEIK